MSETNVIQMPVPASEIRNQLARRHERLHRLFREERAKPDSEQKATTLERLSEEMLFLRDLGRLAIGLPMDSDDNNPFGGDEDF